MDNSKEYNKILKQHFGYDSLKPEQYDIIDKIVNGKRDVCAILATGFGKSLCFQMPYLITKKSVVVISPLIALMADQQKQMEKLNIGVCVLNSDNKNKTNDKNKILNGDNKIIYITPEYLPHCEEFITELNEQNSLALICIDESHCVSTFSDFRPAYAKLGILKDWAQNVPMLAITATASDKVKQDIYSVLQLNDPYIVIGNFDRPNLYLSVKCKSGSKDLYQDIKPLIEKYKNDYIIIYCKTRDETEKMAELITQNGIKCSAYHAGQNSDDRTDTQQEFIDGSIKCIVATIAFGMGINIPNVRLVIHYGCPKNIESYYQEIGRAGRDGKPSECHMFYSSKDFIVNKYFLSQIKNPKYRDYQEQQILEIERYAYAGQCRRKLLLQKFGGKVNSCTNCDNCKKGVVLETNIKKIDYTTECHLLFSIIFALEGRLGSTNLINILRGSNAKAMTYQHKKLKQYGLGVEHSAEWWKMLIRLLLNERFLVSKSLHRKFGSVIELSLDAKKWIRKHVDTEANNITERLCFVPIVNETEKSSEKIKDTDSAKPGSAGAKWTKELEEQLLEDIKTKKIKEIAESYGRTVGSINSRLKVIAQNMYKEKKTIKDIVKATKLTETQVTKCVSVLDCYDETEEIAGVLEERFENKEDDLDELSKQFDNEFKDTKKDTHYDIFDEKKTKPAKKIIVVGKKKTTKQKPN
jgi:Werner syndrome ATP-dependent helicase